jgi:DNA polymerase-3 subunit beta
MNNSFIVPAKTIIEIARLLQDEPCHIQAEKSTVFFSFANIRVFCRVLKGVFPEFRKVIPSKFVSEIQFESRLLRDAAERISLFSSSTDSSSTVNLEFEEDILNIHSRSDIGFGREELKVAHEGEDISISFNSRYLTDVFKMIEGDKTVTMKLSGPLSAGIINEKDDDDFLYLILPVKV